MNTAIRNVRLPLGSRGEPSVPYGVIYAIEADVQKQWQRLLNVARYHCGQREPSLSRLLEWITSTILVDGWRNTVDPEVAARFEKYGTDLFEEVEAGRMQCIEHRLYPDEATLECGAWRIAELEFHHVRPRSKGGHDGPVVPLCKHHHQRVTENKDRTWRQWAVRWGYTDQGSIPGFPAPAGEGEPA